MLTIIETTSVHHSLLCMGFSGQRVQSNWSRLQVPKCSWNVLDKQIWPMEVPTQNPQYPKDPSQRQTPQQTTRGLVESCLKGSELCNGNKENLCNTEHDVLGFNFQGWLVYMFPRNSPLSDLWLKYCFINHNCWYFFDRLVCQVNFFQIGSVPDSDVTLDPEITVFLVNSGCFDADL